MTSTATSESFASPYTRRGALPPFRTSPRSPRRGALPPFRTSPRRLCAGKAGARNDHERPDAWFRVADRRHRAHLGSLGVARARVWREDGGAAGAVGGRAGAVHPLGAHARASVADLLP